MRRGTLAIGVAQMPETADLGRNLREIARFVESARRAGVALLVFPECALTGYAPALHKSSAGFDPDAVEAAVEEVRGLARKSRLALVLGTHLPLDRGWSNSALLIGPDGRIATRYDKAHLYGRDVEFYLAGRAAPAVKAVRGATVGMQICFDLRFPEVSRWLALRRAELIIVIAYLHGKKQMWKRPVIEAHVRSRAAENGRFVLFANAAGPQQNAPSMIADPRGGITAQARRKVRELLLARLDLGRVQDDMLRSRRTDLYEDDALRGRRTDLFEAEGAR
jgi:NAD+ synthase (glutamine-hydrolysing)